MAGVTLDSPCASGWMSAAVLTSQSRIEYRLAPIPQLGPTDLLVRVVATGVCGSDVAVFRGTHPYKRPPIVLGHELAGVVVECGSDVRRFVKGDRVCAMSFAPCGRCAACAREEEHLCDAKQNLSHQGWQGSFAQYVVLRESMSHALPTQLDFVRGMTVEPLTIGLHAVRMARADGDRTAVILGAGNIGLSALLAARRLGYRTLVAVDVSDYKGAMARRCGADAYVNGTTEDPVAAVTRVLPGGADLIIVASGHARALDEAAAMTRRGGEIVVIAYFDGPVPTDLNGLVRHGISVRGSTLSTSREFEEVIGWLARGEVDSLAMVTHYFPLDRAGEAVSLMKDRPAERGKIVLEPFHEPDGVEARP